VNNAETQGESLMKVIVALVIFLLLISGQRAAAAEGGRQVAEPSPRVTPVVKLVQKCLPSVVAIRTVKQVEPGKFVFGAGSGAVIHQDGYILTNNHVVQAADRGEVAFYEGKAYPYRVVARFPPEDLALLKIDAAEPLIPLPLGRSDDLMLGEPVLVIGTPGGLAHTISTGIVSSLHRATATQDAFLPWVIQTTAATSGGSSGGPVINALGQQIGVVASRRTDAENINFAIAADRVREVLPRMIAAEQRYKFLLGMEVDMLDDKAIVRTVTTGEPAAEAGVRIGDVVCKTGDTAVRHGLDFHIGLIDKKPGDELSFQVQRNEKTLSIQATLAELPLAEPVEKKNVSPGLRFAAFGGQWERLPDFDTLSPIATGTAERPSTAAHKPGGEFFGLKFSGLVEVPADGLYLFYTRSDDGSRLYIDNKLVVDNDGLHGVAEAGGLVRLQSGLHRFVVTFFEATGQESLDVAWEGPNFQKQQIPPAAYFHRIEPSTADGATDSDTKKPSD
jgi:S1-C subfamily serine protease